MEEQIKKYIKVYNIADISEYNLFIKNYYNTYPNTNQDLEYITNMYIEQVSIYGYATSIKE